MARLRCLIGLHDNQVRTTDEGEKYLVCARCGKESFPEPAAGGRVVPY
jgi:hypothetical protein